MSLFIEHVLIKSFLRPIRLRPAMPILSQRERSNMKDVIDASAQRPGAHWPPRVGRRRHTLRATFRKYCVPHVLAKPPRPAPRHPPNLDQTLDPKPYRVLDLVVLRL